MINLIDSPEMEARLNDIRDKRNDQDVDRILELNEEIASSEDPNRSYGLFDEKLDVIEGLARRNSDRSDRKEPKHGKIGSFLNRIISYS